MAKTPVTTKSILLDQIDQLAEKMTEIAKQSKEPNAVIMCLSAVDLPNGRTTMRYVSHGSDRNRAVMLKSLFETTDGQRLLEIIMRIGRNESDEITTTYDEGEYPEEDAEDQ